jgi:hypothetical protein
MMCEARGGNKVCFRVKHEIVGQNGPCLQFINFRTRTEIDIKKTSNFFTTFVYLVFLFLSVIAVCFENSCLSQKYHLGLWNGKRWACCRISNRSADGCESCTSWSRTPSTVGAIGLIRNDSVELVNNTAAPARLIGMILLHFTPL